MDKKSQFLYQFRAFFVNSNSIPIPFLSIPISSPIPGIESGIELNSHSIPELTPTLAADIQKLRSYYTEGQALFRSSEASNLNPYYTWRRTIREDIR